MQHVNIIDTNLLYDYSKLVTRQSTDFIVIHHSGTPDDADLSAQTINQMHQNQGWTCIGYHYVIRKDGTIEQGRPHWTIGGHAYGFNNQSIGIHLSGNFEIAQPTDAQIESLSMLLANLCADYGLPMDANHILPHCALNATACPGTNVINKLDIIIGKTNYYYNY